MSDKLRVIMLSEYPLIEAEQGLGGIMQATYQLVEGFIALDDPMLELHIVTCSQSCAEPTVARTGNIIRHYLPKSKGQLGLMTPDPFRMMGYLMRLIRRIRPHVIHGQGTVTSLLLSLWLGKVNVQTIHGIHWNEQKVIPLEYQSALTKLRFRVKIALENYYVRKIKNLITITREIEGFVRGRNNTTAKFYRIDNAIDRAFFDIGERKRDFTENSELKILFNAAITPRKGLHVLIQAFMRLAETNPKIRLSIVGIADWAPDYVAEQRAACSELVEAGRVVFTGGVPRDRLLAEFESADIFVLPSFAESAPMVISQAMCVGLPIVSTRVGGIPEMIEHGVTGHLVEPGDVDVLQDALLGLIGNAQTRRALGEAARAVAFKRYHPRSIAQSTRDVYRMAAGL